MTNTTKHNKVKNYNVKKELAKVEMVFRSIENDKSLPTFGNFFMQCLVMGIAEKVNLKVMYPKMYKKLNAVLKEHNANIMTTRK